jgi:predicted nucleic acid-binding protein
MVLGADTGFFIAQAQKHPQATAVWQAVEEGNHELVVSTVSINELFVYLFRRGRSQDGQDWLSLLISTQFVSLVPVSIEIAQLSARYRHGIGLPTIDSLILATCLDRKCDKLLSTDNDFRIVHEQGVIPVEFLERI